MKIDKSPILILCGLPIVFILFYAYGINLLNYIFDWYFNLWNFTKRPIVFGAIGMFVIFGIISYIGMKILEYCNNK